MKSIEQTIMDVLRDLASHNCSIIEGYQHLIEEFERRLNNGKNKDL